MSFNESPTRTRLTTEFTPRKDSRLIEARLAQDFRSSSVGRKRTPQDRRLTSEVKHINDYRLCPFTNERDSLGRLKPPDQYYNEAGKGTWVEQIYKSIASVKKQTRELSLELRTQEITRRRHSDSRLNVSQSKGLFPGSSEPVWRRTDQLSNSQKGQKDKYSQIVTQAFQKQQQIQATRDSKPSYHHSRYGHVIDHDATIKNCVLTPGQYEVDHTSRDPKPLFFKYKKPPPLASGTRELGRNVGDSNQLSPLKDISEVKKVLEPHKLVPNFARMLARPPFAQTRNSVPSKKSEYLDSGESGHTSLSSKHKRTLAPAKYSMFESKIPTYLDKALSFNMGRIPAPLPLQKVNQQRIQTMNAYGLSKFIKGFLEEQRD